jgi:hypothetical protein
MRVLHETDLSAAQPAMMNGNCQCLTVADAAALRIFRDCFCEYTFLLKECPPDLTPPQVVHFLIDFERVLERALGAFSFGELDRIRAGDISLDQKITIGRHLASEGLWPVESYFARG